MQETKTLQTIKLKKIIQPRITLTQNGDKKFRFKAITDKDQEIRFNVYGKITDKLDDMLCNNLVEIIRESAERKKGNGFTNSDGKYINSPFNYLEVKLSENLIEAFEEKPYKSIKETQNVVIDTSNIETANIEDEDPIIWD